MKNRVCAIVVSYFPDLDHFEKVLSRLCTQCHCIIVDNSDHTMSEDLQQLSFAYETELHFNRENLGIGAAQNTGITFAIKAGFEYFLLLDQDSLIGKDFVVSLVNAFEMNTESIVSGIAIDSRNNEISNAKTKGKRFAEQRELMSSGTLIHRSLMSKIGAFEERLFIDCVDFEWGWRARARNIKLLLVRDARFQHALGDGEKKYRQLPAPVRHYYQARNISFMLKRSYVPFCWKVRQLVLLPLKLLKILCFGNMRLQRVHYLLKGWSDFRKGKYNAL